MKTSAVNGVPFYLFALSLMVGLTAVIIALAILVFAAFIVFRRVRYPKFIPIANMDIGDDDL